jgi:hypothetical protein
MKNPLFTTKCVITDIYKAIAGAGAETNSFGSATLPTWSRIERQKRPFLNSVCR